MPTTLERADRAAGSRRFTQLTMSSDSGVNPLSSDAVRALRDAVREVGADRQVHGLILRSIGRGFCAGADVKEFRSFDLAQFRAYMTAILLLYEEMTQTVKPIVCAVHADALGGGAALAFFSDFVVAADDAHFALPEAHRGLAGGGYLMPRLIGKHRAAEMVMLGRRYTARDMLEQGLVNRVCPAVSLDAEVGRLCEELAAISPGALAVAKRSLAAGLSIGLHEAMRAHVEAQTEAFAALAGRPSGQP